MRRRRQLWFEHAPLGLCCRIPPRRARRGRSNLYCSLPPRATPLASRATGWKYQMLVKMASLECTTSRSPSTARRRAEEDGNAPSSPGSWSTVLNNTLTTPASSQSTKVKTVDTPSGPREEKLILGCYVDDLFCAYSHDDQHSLYHQFTTALQGSWDVEDEGEVHDLLNVEIKRDGNVISMKQTSYIERRNVCLRITQKREEINRK